MESHEVIDKIVSARGVKSVAAELRLAPSLIYKWCLPRNDEDGAFNPLDRVRHLVQATGDKLPVHWLCREFDGFYVENSIREEPGTAPVLQITQRLIKEFSDLLAAVSRTLEDDNHIAEDEAKRIRSEWEDLKTLAERFVLDCEDGKFRDPAQLISQ